MVHKLHQGDILDVSRLQYVTGVIFQHHDAFEFEAHGFVCDLAEESRAVKAEL